ncbi:MAG: hypothetical protein HQL31_01945 [Planctomycetes bacterium]|nr:hypothetical protein [Planctomycetota bacterium]
MALIRYIHAQYGILVRPGKKHFCPFCNHHHKTFSVKSDASLAKCFKCGHYFVLTKSGIYDSTQRPAA